MAEQKKTRAYIVTQRSWRDGLMYEPGDEISIPFEEPPSKTWLDAETMDFMPEDELADMKLKYLDRARAIDKEKKLAAVQKLRADVLGEKAKPAKEHALEKAKKAATAAAQAQRAADKEII